MRIYRDNTSFSHLKELTPEEELNFLMKKRLVSIKDIEGYEVSELLHMVIVDAGDTADDLERHLGFTIMHNRWNGCAHDAESFTPSWDAFDAHIHWYELTFVLSDEGFGIVVFLPKCNSDELIALCDRYANEIYVS